MYNKGGWNDTQLSPCIIKGKLHSKHYYEFHNNVYLWWMAEILYFPNEIRAICLAAFNCKVNLWCIRCGDDLHENAKNKTTFTPRPSLCPGEGRGNASLPSPFKALGVLFSLSKKHWSHDRSPHWMPYWNSYGSFTEGSSKAILELKETRQPNIIWSDLLIKEAEIKIQNNKRKHQFTFSGTFIDALNA